MAGRRTFGGIRQLPSGRFQAYYTGPDGRRHTGPRTFERRTDAARYLSTVEADLVRQAWRAPEPRRAASVRLGDYASAWLERRGDLKASTQALYANLLRLHVLPYLGEAPLDALTPDVVEAWYRALGANTGPVATAQAYRLLRTLLNAAVADGLVPANPCRVRGGGTSRPARARRALAPAEIEAVAAQAPERYRALVLLLAWSGLRIGEALALTRADVAVDGRTVTVRRRVYRIPTTGVLDVDTPKSAAGARTVHLPRHAAAAVAEHLDRFVAGRPAAPVFTTSTGAIPNTSNLRTMLLRAAERAGVQPFALHELRHSAATLAAWTGATTAELQARLGHATPAAAAAYQHAAAERDRALAERLGQLANAQELQEPHQQSSPSDS